MKLEIVTDDGSQESMVRSFMHRKVQFALERWNVEANGVVRLQTDTESWTGICSICEIDLQLSPSRRLHVSAYGESAYDCVLRAIQKLELVLAHGQLRQGGPNSGEMGAVSQFLDEPYSLTEY